MTVSCRKEDAAAPQLDPAPSCPVCYVTPSGELVLLPVILGDPPAGRTVQLCGERVPLGFAPAGSRLVYIIRAAYRWPLVQRDHPVQILTGRRSVCAPAVPGLLPAQRRLAGCGERDELASSYAMKRRPPADALRPRVWSPIL